MRRTTRETGAGDNSIKTIYSGLIGMWTTFIKIINNKEQNNTNLNKCKTSSLSDGAMRRRLVRNNFLCWNKCYETTSDEEI
ncbi:hypothetical protein ALC56_03657 [Trachymyrmex septentrionalis]|uniref:Uncharacterized protein n=1 Tax=Trachymyrmex septentrionalis TaxID=34720 RepID=A0A151JZM7_9HYME|nr:hypothetical protein ALC56_03657 [Trachymyrmex septentrionalis]